MLLFVTTATTTTPFSAEMSAERSHPGQLLVASDPVSRAVTEPAASAEADRETDFGSLAPTGPTVTLVVGDSGAYYLGEGMDRVGQPVPSHRSSTGAWSAAASPGPTAGCCCPTGDILNDPPGCSAYLSRWTTYLRTYLPQRVILVLADVGGGDRYLDGQWRSDCDPIFHSWFEDQAIEALAVLHSTGARVSVTTIPDIATQQPASAARLTDCRNDAVIAAAHATRSQLVDFRHWACPTPSTCVTKRDGVDIRPDDVHFLGVGADLASRWIFSRIHDP